MKEKFLWNTDKTLSIRASRIRNFTIEEVYDYYFVTAWINNTETLRLGQFKTDSEAREHLEVLHGIIESLDD